MQTEYSDTYGASLDTNILGFLMFSKNIHEPSAPVGFEKNGKKLSINLAIPVALTGDAMADKVFENNKKRGYDIQAILDGFCTAALEGHRKVGKGVWVMKKKAVAGIQDMTTVWGPAREKDSLPGKPTDWVVLKATTAPESTDNGVIAAFDSSVKPSVRLDVSRPGMPPGDALLANQNALKARFHSGDVVVGQVTLRSKFDVETVYAYARGIEWKAKGLAMSSRTAAASDIDVGDDFEDPGFNDDDSPGPLD